MPTRTVSDSGGTRNWNDTASWVEGAVPTAADDVVATATSGNLTINVAAACRSISLALYASGKVLTHNAFTLSVGNASGGALNFSGAWTYTKSSTTTSAISFVSTADNGGTGWAVITAGKVLGNVTFVGVGGKWVLQDGLTANGAIATTLTLTSGTLDTNGQAVTVGIFSVTGSLARTLTLGSSPISIISNTVGWSAGAVTNLTVTANTATVTMSVNSSSFSSAAKDWDGLSLVFNAIATQTLVAPGCTFANVTRISGNSTLGVFALGGDFTVTGTLHVEGNNVNPNRIIVQSTALGTDRTITVDGTVTSINADWSDVTAAGSASWDLAAAAGGSGDARGNTGITFTPAVNRYAKAAGSWHSTATWSATDGGSAGVSAPLAQDDVFFTASAGAGTYTANQPRLGRNIDCTGFTRTFTFGLLAAMYGSLTLVPGMTVSGAFQLTFAGRGVHTITSATKTFVNPLAINGPGSVYTLQDALICTGAVTVLSGELDTDNRTVTVLSLASTGIGVRVVNLGTSVVNLTNTGTPWNITGTNVTVSAASSTIVFTTVSAAARTFVGGGATYGTVTYTVAASTGMLTFQASNTIDTLNVSGGARTLRMSTATTTTVTNFNVFGTAGNPISIESATAGSTTTVLAKAGGGRVVAPYVSVKDIRATPSRTWHADPGGVDAGNNTNWTFGPVPIGGLIRVFPGGVTKPTKIFPGGVEKPVRVKDDTGNWVLA